MRPIPRWASASSKVFSLTRALQALHAVAARTLVLHVKTVQKSVLETKETPFTLQPQS